MKMRTEQEAKQIFFKKIDEYNVKKEYYDHYVKLNNERLLLIYWGHSWNYRIEILEEVE